MSVTVINAGTQHNVIPDKCSFVVDIRSNELYSNEELFAEIKKHFPVTPKRVHTASTLSQIDEKHPFVQKTVKLGRVPFGSPTLSDQALMSFPSVKIGPGRSSRSHTAEGIYHAERDRRSCRNLSGVIGWASDLVTSMYIQITFYKNILSGIFNLAHKEEKKRTFLTQTCSMLLINF